MHRAVLLAVLFVAACGGGASEAPPFASQADVRPPPPAEETSENAAPPPAEEKITAEPTPSVEEGQADDRSQRPVEDVPDANLTIGSMTTDGLTARDIACRTEAGGVSLLGTVLVTAWMAPRKAQLDACAKPGTETRVVWKARVGKLLSLSASGDGKVKACVEKAFAGAQPMLEGQCAATVVLGGR